MFFAENFTEFWVRSCAKKMNKKLIKSSVFTESACAWSCSFISSLYRTVAQPENFFAKLPLSSEFFSELNSEFAFFHRIDLGIRALFGTWTPTSKIFGFWIRSSLLLRQQRNRCQFLVYSLFCLGVCPCWLLPLSPKNVISKKSNWCKKREHATTFPTNYIF